MAIDLSLFSSLAEWGQSLDWFSGHQTWVLMQAVREVDVLGQMQQGWNNFVESGQVWALVIGVVVGYMFRFFTG